MCTRAGDSSIYPDWRSTPTVSVARSLQDVRDACKSVLSIGRGRGRLGTLRSIWEIFLQDETISGRSACRQGDVTSCRYGIRVLLAPFIVGWCLLFASPFSRPTLSKVTDNRVSLRDRTGYASSNNNYALATGSLCRTFTQEKTRTNSAGQSHRRLRGFHKCFKMQ